jgi:hypothetical protein
MKAGTKMALGAVALLVFCAGLCSTLALAQMPTVDVTGVTALQSCPSNVGFYTGDPNHQPACSAGTIGCAGTLPITPTWSITNPTAPRGGVVEWRNYVDGSRKVCKQRGNPDDRRHQLVSHEHCGYIRGGRHAEL